MSKKTSLTVGAFQFAGNNDLNSNFSAIQRGIKLAAKNNVRLLLTQECALSGYPPIELSSTGEINKRKQTDIFNELTKLSKQYGMFIALGMITIKEQATHNSVWMITPDGQNTNAYHKRALWGWDAENFTSGESSGHIYDIDGIRVGIRICYEIRFPEYFRELFYEHVDLAIVPFADVGTSKQADKLDVIKSHIVSRAAENAMYILSANTLSQYQLAPTCLVNPDGRILEIAPLNQEALLTGEITQEEPNFGRKGRIEQSKSLRDWNKVSRRK